jgi:phosphatidylserine/phosphatidylglycerophosphate/cardiolipin synthase-like enzyme
LSDAHRRGVAVMIFLDRTVRVEASERALDLVNNGVKALIDDTILSAGSVNFTHSAQSLKAENVLVICDQRLAQAYKENFKDGMTEATPWTP